MRNGPAPRGGMAETVRKVSIGARLMDASLCVVFIYFAATTQGGWRVFWIASACFSAWTAATAPLERLPALVKRILGARRS